MNCQRKTIQERLETPKEIKRGVDKGVEILSETQRIIVELIKANPSISKKELMRKGNLSKKTVDYNIDKLKSIGILSRIGPDRGGHWQIIE